MKTLGECLDEEGVVQNISTPQELEQLAVPHKSVNIMMGQTFDEGQPVDMMKYALVMMNLTDALREAGADAHASWLLADHFMTDINNDASRQTIRSRAAERIGYLHRLDAAYGGDIGHMLSSELSRTPSYEHNLAGLHAAKDANPEFKARVLASVPSDRRDNPKAFDYPFEELATIETMGADIKIGPPYERLYDDPAREYGSFIGCRRFVAVHLTPSRILGTEQHPEVEEFGILPYKKNSKGLGSCRIDPLNDDIISIERLIQSTTDQRALTDLFKIAALAAHRLGNKAPKMPTTPVELRIAVVESYRENIHRPLHPQYSKGDWSGAW